MKNCWKTSVLHFAMVLLIVPVLVTSAASAAPSAPEKLSMTDVTLVSSTVNPPSLHNMYYLAAIDRGYFKSHGLNVTPQQSGGSPLALAAILSGRSQFASVNLNTLSSAVAEAAKLKMVVTGNFYVAGSVVVGEKIRSASDLANSTMACSAVGSGEQTKALAYLRSQKIDTSRIQWVATRSTAMTIQALGAGQADGAFLAQVDAVRAVRMFPKRLRILVDPEEMRKVAPATGGIIVVTTDFMAKSPDIVQAFVTSIVQANRELYQNESAYLSIAKARMPGGYTDDELRELWKGYRPTFGVNGGLDYRVLGESFKEWAENVNPKAAQKSGIKVEDLVERKFVVVALEKLGVFSGAPDDANWR